VLKKGEFQKFIKAHKPDVLCLQETKAEQGQAEVDLPDYALVSRALVKRVVRAEIHTTVMGSDHCPVSVTLKD
jgi:exonuclease III